MRDDFAKAIKDKLAKRIGFRCSNPKCRKPTAGPHSDSINAVTSVSLLISPLPLQVALGTIRL